MADIALLQSAMRHHQAGRLNEAERIYRQILAADPGHFDSLHLLGILAHQTGRHAAAIELIGGAVARNDRIPECHYNLGLACAAAGRMEEAAVHFAKAVTLRNDYAEAHMNLGNAYKVLGKRQDALTCFERALALRPNVAELHYNAANLLADMGDTTRAIDGYGRALALKPDYAEAHNNLGTILVGAGRPDEALACHQRAVTLNPNLIQAHINVGNALLASGRLAEAQSAYQQAAARAPNSAEAHCRLGFVLLVQGRYDDAATRLRRALAIDPNLTVALTHLAKLVLRAGNPVEAFEYVKRALRNERSDELKELFARCVRGFEATTDSSEHRALLLAALSEGWGRPKEFARFAISLVKLDPAVAAWLAQKRAPVGVPELVDSGALAAAAGDPLLRLVLETTRVQDIALERFLTAARAALLERAMSMDEDTDETLAFHCSLARQCFINEYVFAVTPGEAAKVELLRSRLIAARTCDAAIRPAWLAAIGSYMPLCTLPDAKDLPPMSWSEAVGALLLQQITEPQEEQHYRERMPRLTPISDGVSAAVRRQYEENPYPRWVKPAPVGATISVGTYLRAIAPTCRDVARPDGFDVLMAGCGTGQEVIECARKLSDARFLAIDLSLSSLGYAQRQAQSFGLTNIEFAQADILMLESIGRSFDMIESNGVLHHMGDPMRGWAVLVSLLRPGGVMRIGLYSELARRDVVAARAFIAERGYGGTIEDIRRCREEMKAANEATPLKNLTKIGDFFAASECRDLIFHVQEHRLSLPQIKAFLEVHGLEFLGFDVDEAVIARFRTRFPDAENALDLDRWHMFETENPDTFASMYQFLAQKPV
jgi:tetratricopeptide (TPR) repeat protein/SAM-dependent methyltransferase